MRAEIDAVEYAAIFRQQGFQPAQNVGKALERHESFGDLGPVGDRNREAPRLARTPQGGARAGNDPYIVCGHGALQAGLFVQDPVAVEEYRWA